MATAMTKKEALREFHTLYPPKTFILGAYTAPLSGRYIPATVDDAMRRECWNNFTDALCKGKRITPRQYETWDNPF
jgi:hypothetical protein